MKFAKFLRTPTLKNISQRLLLEWLFNLLFYCESGINQYTVQGRVCLFLLEVGYLRVVVLLYHLRVLRVFMRISKSLIRGLSLRYIFLAITDFCSSYITEEEINDLEKLLCLCFFVVLLREVTIHI